jgi:diadenosine tetraphosphatase ApaH/serine/threonine PP2A family protein phosphatase
MRYLILSDIHANLEALEAVLASAPPYDHVLLLGDYVGYGADPNAVIDRVRQLPVAAQIRGNHDKVAVGVGDVEEFNRIAREAIMWTARMLTPDNRAWLAALPQGPTIIDGSIEICHGTTFDEDVYVFDDLDALRSIRSARRPLCLYGHTHVPAVYRLVRDSPDPSDGAGASLDLIGPRRGPAFTLSLEAAAQYLVNCGAVGQPRDGDARAACGLVDTGARSVLLLRTTYDLAAAQAKIIEAGLPEMLAHRLGVGR